MDIIKNWLYFWKDRFNGFGKLIKKNLKNMPFGWIK